jgi:hypothetical protein
VVTEAFEVEGVLLVRRLVPEAEVRHVLQEAADVVCSLNKSAAARRLQAVKQIAAVRT